MAAEQTTNGSLRSNSLTRFVVRWSRLIALGIVFSITQRQFAQWLTSLDWTAGIPTGMVSVLASLIAMSTCFLIGFEIFAAFNNGGSERNSD